MVITNLLEENAKKIANDIALVEIDAMSSKITDEVLTDRRELSWLEFDNMANKYANLFLEKGMKRNSKIGILSTNTLEWLPIYFGILKAGCIAVPINFRFTKEEIKYCVDLTDCEILIFEDKFSDSAYFISNGPSNIKYLFNIGPQNIVFSQNINNIIDEISSLKPDILLNKTDLAAIYFSSGTTGFPKAIVHDHEALMSACITEQKHHLQTKEDIFLCIPPLYHTGAKIHWFGSLLVGGKTIILRGISPKLILNTISQEKCTIVWLLVPWIQDILEEIESNQIDIKDYELSQWRLMHSGAQPIPSSLINKWLNIFPYQQYDTNYGLSESLGPGCVHLGINHINKIGAIGKAGYGWQIKIVDQFGNDVSYGEIGELIVKGNSVMKCYYKDKEASLKSLKDGWLYTGDMAQMDEDNFIFLVDRKKDIIISGGENIYPVQVENEIRKLSKVKDVAVIGIPDDRLGEIVAALIEIKSETECTYEEVIDFCKTIPRYRRPKKLYFDNIYL